MLRCNEERNRSEGQGLLWFPCLAQGTQLICPQLMGFLISTSRSGQNLGSSWCSPSPEKGGRLCVYSCNHFVGPFSTCFFHIQINDVYVYVCISSTTHAYTTYVYMQINVEAPFVLHCHSAHHRGRICRKTSQQGHRCPRLMNMQL